MKRTLFTALLFAFAVGCSGDDNGDDATPNSATNSAVENNSDTCSCRSGQVCIDGACGRSCNDDSECGPARVCESHGDPPELVCVIDDDLPAPDPSAQGFEVFLVTDTSAGEACDVPDPGSDIFAVGLESADGEALGWAAAVADDIDATDNENADTSVLGGSAPDVGFNICPAQYDGFVVSLGCGGNLAVEFRAGSDIVVAESGMRVRVYEWGEQCTTGSVVDQYQLFGCSDAVAVTNADFSSCTLQLGSTHTAETVETVP